MAEQEQAEAEDEGGQCDAEQGVRELISFRIR